MNRAVSPEVINDFVTRGLAMSDEDRVKKLVELTKKHLFPKIKFVTDDVQVDRMAVQLGKIMSMPAEQMKRGGNWMDLWETKGGNACRKAINKKRNDTNTEVHKAFVGR